MNIQTLQTQQQNGLTTLDKKVTIRFFKEKKTSRTYIDGISGFLPEEKINELVKLIKKSIGTSSMKNPDEDSYGFQGNHKDKIAKILIYAGIPENKIVISNS